MSERNVEVVRNAWEAFSRHDNAAIFPLYDPDVEVRDVFGGHRTVKTWAGLRR